MSCGICGNAMELTEPTIRLLCEHQFHTECFLRQFAINTVAETRCSSCNSYITPNDYIEAAEGVHGEAAQNEVVQMMWNSEPRFKETLASIRALQNELTRDTTAANKRVRILKQQMEDEIGESVELIKGKVREYKKKMAATDEYKAYMRSRKKYSAALNRMDTVWGVGAWRLRRALHNVAAAQPYLPTIRFRFGRCYLGREFNVRIE